MSQSFPLDEYVWHGYPFGMESLVSTDWLASRLDVADLVVVDATKHLATAGRDEGAEYLAAHIPGARFLNFSSIVDASSPVPSAHPTPAQLANCLSALGISPDKRIVFYDDSAVKTAARAWYLCRAHGMDNVAILDGGLAKWKAEGRPLESGMATYEPAPMFDLPDPGTIKYKADMLDNIDSCERQVVDARDAGRFSGVVEDTLHNLPSGHIPGSCNLPFGNVFAADGTYKSANDLRALFEQAGIALDGPITATCGSGVTACVLLFALDRIGHSDLALYDGSWLDWGSDPDTPKATVSL